VIRDDLARACQRLSKMLLRYGRVYPKRACWTKQHRLWLADQRWDHPASELAFSPQLAGACGPFQVGSHCDRRSAASPSATVG
jgi:hypothetical protein